MRSDSQKRQISVWQCRVCRHFLIRSPCPATTASLWFQNILITTEESSVLQPVNPPNSPWRTLALLRSSDLELCVPPGQSHFLCSVRCLQDASTSFHGFADHHFWCWIVLPCPDDGSYLLIYRRASWLLPCFGSYEQSCCKPPHAGFCVDVSFRLFW